MLSRTSKKRLTLALKRVRKKKDSRPNGLRANEEQTAGQRAVWPLIIAIPAQIIRFPQRPKRANENESGEHALNERRMADATEGLQDATVGLRNFTIALVVVAIISAGVSALQWWEIHSGGADTHELAEAAKDQASAFSEQVRLQKEILNRTYRPLLTAEAVEAGELTITEKEIRANITFIFHNDGQFAAEDVEVWDELLPIEKAVSSQQRICDWAKNFQILHLSNLAKQNLPQVYKVIRHNEQYPMRNGIEALGQIEDFKNNLPKDHFAKKWINPAFVGCIAYRGADDGKIHITKFLYLLREREQNGELNFIEIDPHVVPGKDVVITRWPEGGNEQD